MLFYLSIKSNCNIDAFYYQNCNKLVIVFVGNHVLLAHFLLPKLLFIHVKFKKFSRGALPPQPPARGSAPGTRWGLRPQTPAGARSARSATSLLRSLSGQETTASTLPPGLSPTQIRDALRSHFRTQWDEEVASQQET